MSRTINIVGIEGRFEILEVREKGVVIKKIKRLITRWKR